MKSYFSISRINLSSGFLLAALLSSFTSLAQPGNDSPYSGFKLGNEIDNGTIRSSGLGGLNVALDDQESRTLNYMNPASYAYMDSQKVVFDVGATWTLAQLADVSGTENVNKANLAYLSFGFPVTKWWKAAFGLRPMTSINYRTSRSSNFIGLENDTVKISNVFEGKGGINRFFVGSAFKVYKGLSLGFNFNYLFGGAKRIKRKEFNQAGYFNTKHEINTQVGSVYMDFGLQYALKIKDSKLVIGINGSPTWNIQASEEYSAITYHLFTTGTDNPKDSIPLESSIDGSVRMPLKVGAGLTYVVKDKWLFGVQFNSDSWSQYRGVDGLADTNLTDSWRLTAGIELRPGNTQRGFWNYFKKMNYRVGGFYSNSPIISKGTQVPEYGITVGMGYPIRHRSSSGPLVTSMINIAAEFGQRGNSSLGHLTEQYVNLKLGFAINDMWFFKRKYN
jgi:hypothetical protein